MRVPHAPAAVAAVLAAAALSACGGSSGNGVASKSASDIVKAASNATTHAKSVHVAGSITTSGVPLNLDLSLVSGHGGRGQVSKGGLAFRVLDVGQTVYLYGTPSFWQRYANAAAAAKIAGRWVKAPASGPLASLASLTDMQRLMSSLLGGHGKPLTKGPTSTLNGQQVVEVSDKTGSGISYYVATSGPPYLVEIKRQGTSTWKMVFDRYNQAVSLSPPANVVPLSQLG